MTTPFVYADGGGSGFAGRSGQPGAAVVDERRVLIRGVAVRVRADGVDPVGPVAALRRVGRREAPVAVTRLGQPVVDLRADPERVVDAPAPRRPALLGHEQRRHQRLEHAAAPRRRDPRPRVRQRALVHRLAEVGARRAERLRLDPGPVAGVRERAIRAVVLARGDAALLDADVGRDPALGDGRVVAAHRLAGRGHVVEEDPVDLRPVVEAEVHRVEQRLRARAQLAARGSPRSRRPIASQPLSTEDRIGVAGRRRARSVRQRAVADVVPVEVLAGVAALHRLERPDRPREPRDRLAVADDPQPLGRHRAPQVGADVGRGGRRAAHAVLVDEVGGQPRVLVGHRDHRRPRAPRIALERIRLRLRGRRRQQHDEQPQPRDQPPPHPTLRTPRGLQHHAHRCRGVPRRT